MALVHCIRDKIDYLATRLYNSMEGIGTDDKVLIRIIVSRSEIDLGDIKVAFQNRYGKSLAEFVQVSIILGDILDVFISSYTIYRTIHLGITKSVYFPS